MSPLWPGAVVRVAVLFMGRIDLFEYYSYLIGPCAKNKSKKKKNLKEQLCKYVNMEEQWTRFPNHQE